MSDEKQNSRFVIDEVGSRTGPEGEQETVLRIRATDSAALEAADQVVDAIAQLTGGESASSQRPTSSQFGFRAENWKAGWQPKGPNKPYRH